MNKYLMLSAAAALATTGAHASTVMHSFQFANNTGGSYCDGGTIYSGSSGPSVVAWQHTNNNCTGQVSFGQGLEAKFNGSKVASMSDNEAGQHGHFSYYYNYVLPKRITPKAHWGLYLGLNGTSSFLLSTGTFLNIDAPKGNVKSHKSTTSNLKQLIALHKTQG